MIKKLVFSTAIALIFSTFAHAHIRVTSPVGRMGVNDSAKFTQANPANPGPDNPGPCSTFTTPMTTRLQYTTGQSINIGLTETINHPGRFIVQFSPAGPTGFWRPENQLANVADTQSGGTRSIPITFPATPCDNCMMRVLQQMDDQVGEFYVQCFDIRLVSGTPPPPPTNVDTTPVNSSESLNSTSNAPKFGGGCGTITAARPYSNTSNNPTYYIFLLLVMLIPVFAFLYFRKFSMR